jgi:hypothetical protein
MTGTLLPLPYWVNQTPSLLTPFLSYLKANYYCDDTEGAQLFVVLGIRLKASSFG